MARTVVALYEDKSVAQQAVSELASAGFDRSQTQMMASTSDASSVVSTLSSSGVPNEQAEAYAEGVSRGGALVTAQVPDSDVDRAIDILDRYSPIDIQRRSSEWRSSGWTGFGSTVRSTADRVSDSVSDALTVDTSSRTTQRTDTQRTGTQRLSDADETIKVVEEDITVGKRAVESGGVRVTSHVREVPVEEQVTLREEHVQIERRPVDRPATQADFDAFKEGTIEMRETSEEAVVGKTARVVEEIGIRKEVSERVETVRDTVRETDVQVEQIGGTTTRSSGYTTDAGYDTYATRFRSNFQTTYGNSGATYEEYEPAYRYGYTLASDAQYRDRDWNSIEKDVRRDWESRNQGPWENFKDSVKHAWDSVRGRA